MENCIRHGMLLVLFMALGGSPIESRSHGGLLELTLDTCNTPGYQCSADCHSLQLCAQLGTSYQLIDVLACTSDGLYCDAVGRNCSHDADVCRVVVPFKCNMAGTFPDPYYCTLYHVCGDEGGQETATYCDRGYAFDTLSGACNISTDNIVCTVGPVPECLTPGQTGALERNPAIYYICSEEGPMLYICLQGQYNPSSYSCQDTSFTTDSSDTSSETTNTDSSETSSETDTDSSDTSSETTNTDSSETSSETDTDSSDTSSETDNTNSSDTSSETDNTDSSDTSSETDNTDSSDTSSETTSQGTTAAADTCSTAGYACSADCNRVELCLDTGTSLDLIVMTKCVKGQTSCNLSLRSCTSVSDCHPVVPFKCNMQGVFPDLYNCTLYHYCARREAIPVTTRCPEGLAYDASTYACDLSVTSSVCRSNQVPECTYTGQTGALTINPSFYYICVDGSPQLFMCTHGTYNPALYQCVD